MVVACLGVALVFGFVAYALWSGEVTDDFIHASPVPDVTVNPSVSPNASSVVPSERFLVVGEQSFSFSNISKLTLVEREYVVSNLVGVPISVSVRAVSTVDATVSLSWDKTEAVVPVGGSVVFRLVLLVDGDGGCTVRVVEG
jgi:hypothetical protein